MRSWSYDTKDGRQVLIRPATVRDAEDLYHSYNAVVAEGRFLPALRPSENMNNWARWIRETHRGRDVILIASIDDEYVGHVTLQPEVWEASKHVARLGILVAQKFRCIGIGRALMLSAEDAAREMDFEKIVLSTFHDNIVARHLYSSLGYREVGIRTRHFKMKHGYVDEVLMEKWIANSQNL